MSYSNLKIIALIKLVRACIALALSIALFLFSAEEFRSLLEHIVSDPDFSIFFRIIGALPIWLLRITDDHLSSFAILFLVLAVIRFSEALGIWLNRRWAQWLAVITGAVGLIFFSKKLIEQYDGVLLTAFTLNLLIVAYLIWVLRAKRI